MTKTEDFKVGDKIYCDMRVPWNGGTAVVKNATHKIVGETPKNYKVWVRAFDTVWTFKKSFVREHFTKTKKRAK